MSIPASNRSQELNNIREKFDFLLKKGFYPNNYAQEEISKTPPFDCSC